MKISKPLTREEVKLGDMIQPGIYPFEVLDAVDEISKSSGNDMIKLILKIYLPDGRVKTIFDYLLESMEYKMAHFFESVGAWSIYERGDFDSNDCIGKAGMVKIYIQKDKSGLYPDKSAVQDYILDDTQKDAKLARIKSAAPDMIDDDLPF